MNYLTHSDKSFLQQLNLEIKALANEILDDLFGWPTDGPTNATSSAMADGEALEDVPDQAKENPGLLNSYIHGVSERYSDILACMGEMEDEVRDIGSELNERLYGEFSQQLKRAGFLITKAEKYLASAQQSRQCMSNS